MRSAERAGAPWLPPPQTANPLRLGLRNLRILPTRLGWLWLAVLALLLLLGSQSQRNGPLLLAYLMLALWLLALLLCHRNLEGLELEVLQEPGGAGFADDTLALPLLLRSQEPRDGVVLQGSAPLALRAGDTLVRLPWRAAGRGLQQPGRLRLHSTAPLGLFVCWCPWQPEAPQLVYPARRAGPVVLAADPSPQTPAVGAAVQPRPGSDSWHDLRPQRPQDSPTRVAWKVLAQGRGRHSKELQDDRGAPPWWGLAAGIPPEQALEHLCEQVCRSAQSQGRYGLVLPGCRIPPDRGRRHRARCLRALALAELGD